MIVGTDTLRRDSEALLAELRAAGATVSAPLEETRERVLAALEAAWALREPKP